MAREKLIKLLKPLHADLHSVEGILRKILLQIDEPLNVMLKTSLIGGKRLRPALVILSGRLMKISSKKFHVLAAAVEVLHSATLIHDDLVDNALLRRGHKTIHALWPTGATVLAGDYLLAQSVSLVALLDTPEVLKILAEMLHTMSTGEIRHHYARKDRRKREEYFQNINAKTASLFAGAMEMVGVLGRSGRSKVTSLRNFGYEFGIAYQIIDDVMDFISTERRLGKPVGSDLAQGIVTLPVIIYLERGNDKKLINRVLSGKGTSKDVKTAIRLIRKSGAINSAMDEAREHASKSKSALSTLPASKNRQLLYDLVEYIIDRKH